MLIKTASDLFEYFKELTNYKPIREQSEFFMFKQMSTW